MTIYEKYIGRTRDSFESLKDAQENFKISYPDNFNFAYDVIDELGTTKPHKLAMIWVSNEGEEMRFTFQDLKNLSNKAANYFTSLGIVKGDRVLLVLKRSYLFWIALLGLHKIGAIGIQATHMLMAKDYVYRCQAAEIKAVIITGDNDVVERFEEGVDACPTVRIKITTKQKKAKGWLNFEEGLAQASDQFERLQDLKATDIMLMAFTSGTNGYPKMVLHDFTYPLGHIITGVFWHRVVDGGLHFTISDTGWLKALWGKFYGQWFGESAVLVYDFEKFHAADILSKLEQYKVTTFCVPPTMYRLLLQEDVSKYNLKSLVHCNAAGEALNPEIFNTWKAATGLEIYEGFGQTETTCVLATLKGYETPEVGFIGKATPGFDVQILNEDGNPCMPGEVGEICIRGTLEHKPCGIFKGYYKNDEATKEAWRSGFYHTGDKAYIDEFKRVRYVGRTDDVIKSSGYRIGPFEVESVLLEHDAVLEVAVTGIPDPVRGFNVKATIVLKPGYEPSEALTKELQDYVKHNTAPYKYPRVVEYVKELPKTFNGKIRRTEIRQRDIQRYNAEHGTNIM